MTTVTLPGTRYRIQSIDIVRGLIMLIMAIDHTRDFFHAGSPSPTNLATTTPMLFFTRWITHFCAALFVFLSGVSVNLAGTRRTKKQLSMFLIKRGLWLVGVEFVLLTFAITLDPFYHILIFQVIWVMAVSMIVLGLLIWLPLTVIGTIGALLFFGHDILNFLPLPTEGTSGFLWKFFFTAAALFQPVDKTHSLLVLYTIMPWMGVMFMGYVLGQVYKPGFDALKRRKTLLTCGIGLLALFVILRTFNIYGEPVPWAVQKTFALSVISFFNVSKYPPSLMYLCMTIGPGLIMLGMIERTNNAFTRFLNVYGQVPFFYYVLHFYLLRVFNIILFFAQGYTTKDIFTPNSLMLFRPVNYGVNLFGVYVVWLLVILTLYLPCRWFSKYKQTHRQWWLSYL
ncbi:DUF1624 domain-containing protein [Mucilaginibacter sp. AK015]|uniref:DUF1624 domain-containing protein n=1 Tax=Mucilaginibacter sp. AK015 TaxID=2723072 RepID=UPI00181DF662|nr:heparan-alpha-glucosaminide N-acetyltransferase domain-containing protein [Mucilaginibacter sp. AK015]MBB5397224.1 putative membrane protein [Mucilaginibacter sp. AK015]